MDNEIMFIKLDDIIPNRFQPREVFDDESLNKLAESIKQHGVIEPILVRPVSNKYEIIAGERRYKASVLAGLTKIPAMVRQLDDKESSILAFIENEHRSDVSAIEEARTMDRILKTNNMTQEELGKELGVNQSTIANKLRLLNLPLEVQESLMHNEISERHARSLLSVKNEEKQIELLKKIKEKRMTVRELDSEIKNMNDMNIYSSSQNNIEPGFMNYLNNYDNSNPLPQESNNDESILKPEISNYLNDYNNSPLKENLNEPVINNDINKNEYVDYSDIINNPILNNLSSENGENKTSNSEQFVPSTPAVEPGFMNFLNNYDNNNPLPQEPKQEEITPDLSIPTETVATPELSTPAVEQGFMDYLNNYDNNNPLPQEPKQEEITPDLSIPTETVATSELSTPAVEPGFMDYLNNYDNNNPLLQEPKQEEIMPDLSIPTETVATPELSTPVEEPGFMNFLNNYDNNNPLPQEPKQEEITPDLSTEEPTQPGFNESIYSNFSESTDNVMINDVVPPITTNFGGQYVENNPNYIDVSKQVVIDNVDEIINKLKVVVDDIKSSSKFKIDTDEINYDDIYQITIKIDKRDF